MPIGHLVSNLAHCRSADVCYAKVQSEAMCDSDATKKMTTPSNSRKYRAFISYSHSDERWAAWLQRSLEKYRVPRNLVQKHPDRRRLNPIFRDKEELASSTDLGDSIRSALVQSDALVVMCSPTAAASQWVNEEIHLFRELAPNGRILCCLVDGNTYPDSPDCAFPPALLKNAAGEDLPEPLAADIRETGDGKRGAFLKIAAGLLEVGIDDLRQRDLQRKIRFLSAAAFGAMLVAVTTAVLAISAHLARQESDLRRTQAENLIDFMLVELRDQLEPIGKLNILDSVGDQALEYFAALGDKGTPDEVLDRALALRQIGEVRFNEGRLEAALDAFSESRDVAAELYRATPRNNHYLFELGQSEFWIGYVAWERGDLENASLHLERYMQRTRELLELEPENPDYQLELMYAHNNLGSVAREAGQSEDALQHFTIFTTMAEALTKDNPEDPDAWNELRDSQSWLGATYVDLGELTLAQSSYRSAAESGRRAYTLKEKPSNKYNYATELLHLSTVQMHLGEPVEALETLYDSRQVLEELVEFDTQNARWQRDFARTNFRQAEAFTAVGQLDKAMESVSVAKQISGDLAERDPTYANHQLDLASIERLQAKHQLQKGKPTLALALAQHAHQRVEKLLGGSSMKTLLIEYALITETLGRLLAISGDEIAAKTTWQRGLEVLPMAEQCDLLQAAARLLLLSRLEMNQEKGLLIRKIEEAGFRDPRFALFAISAGSVVE